MRTLRSKGISIFFILAILASVSCEKESDEINNYAPTDGFNVFQTDNVKVPLILNYKDGSIISVLRENNNYRGFYVKSGSNEFGLLVLTNTEGAPQKIISEDEYILIVDNFRSESVDLSIINPQGKIQVYSNVEGAFPHDPIIASNGRRTSDIDLDYSVSWVQNALSMLVCGSKIIQTLENQSKESYASCNLNLLDNLEGLNLIDENVIDISLIDANEADLDAKNCNDVATVDAAKKCGYWIANYLASIVFTSEDLLDKLSGKIAESYELLTKNNPANLVLSNLEGLGGLFYSQVDNLIYFNTGRHEVYSFSQIDGVKELVPGSPFYSINILWDFVIYNNTLIGNHDSFSNSYNSNYYEYDLLNNVLVKKELEADDHVQEMVINDGNLYVLAVNYDYNEVSVDSSHFILKYDLKPSNAPILSNPTIIVITQPHDQFYDVKSLCFNEGQALLGAEFTDFSFDSNNRIGNIGILNMDDEGRITKLVDIGQTIGNDLIVIDSNVMSVFWLGSMDINYPYIYFAFDFTIISFDDGNFDVHRSFIGQYNLETKEPRIILEHDHYIGKICVVDSDIYFRTSTLSSNQIYQLWKLER